MLEQVMNPLAWWGLLAVAVPILIHLINRLRYRKLEWAAMEFLLKAMQKNKRKMLLEQLLLLLLRCLLIALVVLFLVRPLWFLGDAGAEGGPLHHHLFVVDDSFSMLDQDEAGSRTSSTAASHAEKLLADLAFAHAGSSVTHHWTVLSWSNPQVPVFGPALTSDNPLGIILSNTTTSDLVSRLESLRPGALAASPLVALQQAARHLELAREGRRHLHIVSDFRAITWQQAGEEAYQLLGELARQNQVKIHLHDVARPPRAGVAGLAPPAHGNLAIVRLVPRPRRTPDSLTSLADQPLRVVTPRLPFDVHVTVKNFGTAEHSRLQLSLASDNIVKQERFLDRLASGEELTLIFNMEYSSEEPVGIKTLTARLQDSEDRDHLPVDNIRYAHLELRSKLSVLLIDPEARNSQSGADWLYVSAALTGSARTGIETEVITPRELGSKRSLASYTAVYVLNIAGVGRSEGDLDEEGLRVLERYLRQGGAVAWFLGPRTNVASFNEKLYAQGKGIFPAPLLLRPDPEGRKASTFIDDEPDKDDYFAKLRFLKMHPAFPFTGDIADTFARFIHINRYFRIDPQWKPGEGFDVLVQLMNRRPLSLYREQALQLIGELALVAGQVPEGKLSSYVEKLRASIEDAESKKARKGELLEALAGALGEPAAASFWKEPRHAELQKKLRDFVELLQQGDPVVVEAPVSGGARPGRVVVFLHPAAPTPVQGKDYGWHDMATGDLAQFFFVPMILGLQEHLSAQSRLAEMTSTALITGQPLEIRLDKDRYHPQVELWYQGDNDKEPLRVDVINAERVKPLGDLPPADDRQAAQAYDWLIKVQPLRGAGHYRLKFNQVSSSAGAAPAEIKSEASIQLDTSKLPEERPLAFNLDVRQESSLERLSEEQWNEALVAGLQQGSARLPLTEARDFVTGKTWFIDNALEYQAYDALQSHSWSEYSWVLLLFIGLLILEQYLAMKFSHHLR